MTELLVLNAGKSELQTVSLDGTRARTLVAGLDELPDGIVVDQRRGHVYWTNMGAVAPAPEKRPTPAMGHWKARISTAATASPLAALGKNHRLTRIYLEKEQLHV